MNISSTWCAEPDAERVWPRAAAEVTGGPVPFPRKSAEGRQEEGCIGMIRPILYVNLPAVVYALDRHARSRRGEFARFICAPDAEEPRSGLTSLLNALILIHPN